MQTFTIFTDPHLGTRRAAHTTRDSSNRLTEALYRQAKTIVDNHPHPICAGDLFDKSQNVEATLVQGYAIASRCEFTLAGNHDQTNREGTVTSLDALKEMGCPIVSSPNLSTPYFDARGPLYIVPHHASQALFEEAMTQAASHACIERAGKPAVLMLHCNYDCAFAQEDDTLNLSAGTAQTLLEQFDLILLGHEHKPASHFDGRVVILGNTHPTSFADISNKYVYTLEITDDAVSLEKECIWSAAVQHTTVRFGDYDALGTVLSAEFIDVIGTAGAEQAVEVAEFIQAVWTSAPNAFAVRNSVHIGDALGDVEINEAPKLVDLKTKIVDDLEGSDLQALYKELLQEVEA